MLGFLCALIVAWALGQIVLEIKFLLECDHLLIRMLEMQSDDLEDFVEIFR